MATQDMLAAGQNWHAERYRTHAGFVAELGTPLLDLLSPKPGEKILDLGCGDGMLTAKIEALGAKVVGIDASPSMVEAAQGRGLDARLLDGQSLDFNGEFDAVMSNAALHWMKDPDAVIRGVAASLKPKGRFIAEFGGHGNVAAITVALVAALERFGMEGADRIPWYFPTVDAYAAKLTKHGFAVGKIDLIPRPTPLPTNMSGWLKTFASSFLADLSQARSDEVTAYALSLLRPVLCDDHGRWTADYVRLRFIAQVPG